MKDHVKELLIKLQEQLEAGERAREDLLQIRTTLFVNFCGQITGMSTHQFMNNVLLQYKDRITQLEERERKEELS